MKRILTLIVAAAVALFVFPLAAPAQASEKCVTVGWDCADAAHEVLPGVGAGYVFLGMTRAQAAAALKLYGSKVEQEEDGALCGAFDESGDAELCADFGDDGRVAAVAAAFSSEWYVVAPSGKRLHLLSASPDAWVGEFGWPEDAYDVPEMSTTVGEWSSFGLDVAFEVDASGALPVAVRVR